MKAFQIKVVSVFLGVVMLTGLAAPVYAQEIDTSIENDVTTSVNVSSEENTQTPVSSDTKLVEAESKQKKDAERVSDLTIESAAEEDSILKPAAQQAAIWPWTKWL